MEEQIYTVQIEMNVTAPTPRAAALYALDDVKDPALPITDFIVTNERGESVEVKLSEYAQTSISKAQSKCQNCEAIWEDEELAEPSNLFSRVSPGEPMPSGECPGCGALCQPIGSI